MWARGLRRDVTGDRADVDTGRLEAYLATELDEPAVETTVLADGLNLTVGVSVGDGEPDYVLRRPGELRDTEGFIPLAREYRLLERLEGTPVGAPEPVLRCEDPSLVGGPFIVTSHVEGAGIHWGDRLPEGFREAPSRRRLAHLLVDTLAALHTLDVERFADVCERVPPPAQVERTVESLDAATSVTGHDLPALWAVADWLRANAPAGATTALVHGDYKPDNVFVTWDDRPALAGVVDWETGFLGDPLTELGTLLFYWFEEGDPAPSVEDIAARHPEAEGLDQLRERREQGFWPFTSAPGSPDRRELVARYEELTGTPFEHERFYRAMGAFMLATVWEHLHRREIEAGAEPTPAPHVEYVAAMADSIVEGELEL